MIVICLVIYQCLRHVRFKWLDINSIISNVSFMVVVFFAKFSLQSNAVSHWLGASLESALSPSYIVRKLTTAKHKTAMQIMLSWECNWSNAFLKDQKHHGKATQHRSGSVRNMALNNLLLVISVTNMSYGCQPLKCNRYHYECIIFFVCVALYEWCRYCYKHPQQ